MKKLLIVVAVLAHAGGIYAQDQEPPASPWKLGGLTTLMFNQTSLNNWAAGGENSIAFNGYLALIANYKKDRASWDNRLDAGYGLIKQGDAGFTKADDKLALNSKYGYAMKEGGKLYMTVLLDFKTQFYEGVDGEAVISRFMAPGYLNLGVGFDYKPSDNFSLFYSPVNGKFTIVNDDDLSAAGAFGVTAGEKFRAELGSYFRGTFNKEILKNVVLDTKLELFANYLEKFGNIDVNWELNLNMKVNKLITATVLTNLIYDDDIKIVLETDADGNVLKSGPRTQFKSVIGVGLTYNFGANVE